MTLLMAAFTTTQSTASGALVPAESPKPYDVRWIGTLRKVMHDGDLRGYADLAKMSQLQHLYALGPVEELRGEATVWDVPLISPG